MIIGTNHDVIYDEEKGIFTIKNKSIWNIFDFFNMNKTFIYENDISINKLNELRKIGNCTVLTNYDIDILYQFAKTYSNYNKNKYYFVNEPLKNIYKNIKKNIITIPILMPMAFDYITRNNKFNEN